MHIAGPRSSEIKHAGQDGLGQVEDSPVGTGGLCLCVFEGRSSGLAGNGAGGRLLTFVEGLGNQERVYALGCEIGPNSFILIYAGPALIVLFHTSNALCT